MRVVEVVVLLFLREMGWRKRRREREGGRERERAAEAATVLIRVYQKRLISNVTVDTHTNRQCESK